VSTAPAAANIGGPAKYWQAYSYDLLRDRTAQTSFNTSLPAAQDTLANATVQQVAYPGGTLTPPPATAQPQPDAPASIVTSSPGGTTTTTPVVNAAGGTTKLTSTTTGTSPPAGPPSLTGVAYNVLGQAASTTSPKAPPVTCMTRAGACFCSTTRA
jgi:hypothetical protein